MTKQLSAERWAWLESLFVEAVDLAPVARARFVESECGNDEELREQLLSLLRYDTVDQPEVEAALGAGAAWVVDGDALEGRMLGAYRIERELGRGGMSVVYLAARDDGEFRKRVAVKLIKRGMDSDAVMERLRRERRILAGLEHPYMARLLDGGTTPDGRPYIVMEYVDGRPIDRYCIESGLDPAARCALVEKVCEAISYMHRNLVVHRDLKPANILVTADGTPRLLDFGIARVLEGDPGKGLGDSGPETRGISQALTPEYASPEQLAGASSGTGADVYSLGVILFELLAGTRPYGSGTAACGRAPERASLVAARNRLSPRYVNQLEGDLDNILLKAIHPDPLRRYQSVEQLQRDLHCRRIGLPVAARGDSAIYRAGKFVTRHRFGTIAAAAAILAMVAGLAATLWQAHAAQNARSVAEGRRLEAERERTRAQDSARQSAAARERAESSHAEAETERARAELQKTAAETERALADRRFEQVRELARKFTTDFHDAIAPLPGSTPARKMLVETGLKYYDSLAADAAGNRELLEEIARGYDKLGDAQGNPYYSNLGDRPGALASYEKAQALRARISDDSSEFLADRLFGSVRRAQIIMQTGDFPAAERVLDDALELAARTPHSGDYIAQQALAKAWTQMGDLKSQSERLDQAISAYEKLLGIWTALSRAGRDPRAERTGIALAHTKLGDTYSRMDRGPEALEHLRPAVAIDEDMAASEPNSIPRLRKLYVDYVMISWAYDAASSSAIATPEVIRSALEKATVIAERMAATDAGNTTVYSDVALSHLNYANWFRREADHASALTEFQKYANAMQRFTEGRPHTMEFDDARVRANMYLARGLADAGKPEEALVHTTTAAEILASLEKQNPGLPHLVHERVTNSEVTGQALLALKKWPEAIACFTGVLSDLDALRDSTTEEDDNVRDAYPFNRASLADAYAGVGQTENARAAMNTALGELRETETRRALSPDELELRKASEAKLIAWK